MKTVNCCACHGGVARCPLSYFMCNDLSCGENGYHDFCCELTSTCGTFGRRPCNTSRPALPDGFCNLSPQVPPAPPLPPAPPTAPPSAPSISSVGAPHDWWIFGVFGPMVVLGFFAFWWKYRSKDRKLQETQKEVANKEIELARHDGQQERVHDEIRDEIKQMIAKLTKEGGGTMKYYGSDENRLASEAARMRLGDPNVSALGLRHYMNLPADFQMPHDYDPEDGAESNAVQAIKKEFEESNKTYESGATDPLLIQYVLYGKTGSPERIKLPSGEEYGGKIVSLVPEYWLKWKCHGEKKPGCLKKSCKIHNDALSTALSGKTKLEGEDFFRITHEEWKSFGISELDLTKHHYIKVGGKYYQPVNPGQFKNGVIDEQGPGRPDGRTFNDFFEHQYSRRGRLSKAHVLALRMYTTAAYERINEPLRKQSEQNSASKKHRLSTTHPFKVTVHYLNEGINKLKVLNDGQKIPYLWRGLRDMTVPSQKSGRVSAAAESSRKAMSRKSTSLLQSSLGNLSSYLKDNKFKGTEFAPMSTTSSLEVALRYAAPGESKKSILLRIEGEGEAFTRRGADLEYMSAFPKEKEVLYPPLTLLTSQENRGPRSVEVETDDGVVFLVLCLKATMATVP